MRIFTLLLFFVVTLLLFCAQQSAPSGGPMDDIPPRLVSVTPNVATLNVPLDASVIFTFSEWINIREAEKSVTVFPTLADDYSVVVNGRRLIIRPKKKFADSTTYHIGLTILLKDLHGVNITVPISHYFSTGSMIDSGTIRGCIATTSMSKNQPMVALYRLGDTTISDSSLLNLPHYLVQADSLGHFAFEHIRSDIYCLMAFVDSDNNGCITPASEQVFAPLDRIVKVKKHPSNDPKVLYAISSDTSITTVASVEAISSMIIKGIWSKPIHETVGINAKVEIISRDSLVTSPIIDSMILIKGATEFYLMLQESLAIAPYSLVYTQDRPFTIWQDSTDTLEQFHSDTVLFNGIAQVDTTPPIMQRIFLDRNKRLDPICILQWDHAVRPIIDSVNVYDTLGDTITFFVQQEFSKNIKFIPKHNLTPGSKYFFSIYDSLFEDIVSNKPNFIRDSADTLLDHEYQISIEIELCGTYCLGLIGNAKCLTPNDNRYWIFSSVTDKNDTAIVRDSAGFFVFDTIVSCKGLFSYYIDENQNGVYNRGKLFPWVAPEQIVTIPDTIEARARWMIEGIELLNGCMECLESQKNDSLNLLKPNDDNLN